MEEIEKPYYFLPFNQQSSSSKLYSRKWIAIKVTKDVINSLNLIYHLENTYYLFMCYREVS